MENQVTVNKRDLYCALLTCAVVISDFQNERIPEPYRQCQFCKYLGDGDNECFFRIYQRLGKMAHDLGVNISPLLWGDGKAYAVRLDESGGQIVEQFEPVPHRKLIPWAPGNSDSLVNCLNAGEFIKGHGEEMSMGGKMRYKHARHVPDSATNEMTIEYSYSEESILKDWCLVGMEWVQKDMAATNE